LVFFENLNYQKLHLEFINDNSQGTKL
jgi:hypothetical protein